MTINRMMPLKYFSDNKALYPIFLEYRALHLYLSISLKSGADSTR